MAHMAGRAYRLTSGYFVFAESFWQSGLVQQTLSMGCLPICACIFGAVALAQTTPLPSVAWPTNLPRGKRTHAVAYRRASWSIDPL